MDPKGNLSGSLPHIGYMNKLKRDRESQFSIKTTVNPPNPFEVSPMKKDQSKKPSLDPL
jgi:hypothetical protein